MGTGGVIPGVVTIPKEDEDSAFENFMEFMLEGGMTVGGAVIGGIVGGGNPYAIQAGAHIGNKLASEIIDEEPKIPSGLVSLGAMAYAQVGDFSGATGEALKEKAYDPSVLSDLRQPLSAEAQAMIKANEMHSNLSQQFGFGPVNAELAVRMGENTQAQVGLLGGAAQAHAKTSSELQDAMTASQPLHDSVAPDWVKEKELAVEQERLAALADQQVPIVQPGEFQVYEDQTLDRFDRAMSFNRPPAADVTVPMSGTAFVNPMGRRTGDQILGSYSDAPDVAFPGSPNVIKLGPQAEPEDTVLGDAFLDNLYNISMKKK